MDTATTQTPLMATAFAPQTRLLPTAPRHAFASRRLMSVRAGSPTIVACVVAFGVLASSALGGAPQHHTASASAAPVTHIAPAAPHGA